MLIDIAWRYGAVVIDLPQRVRVLIKQESFPSGAEVVWIVVVQIVADIGAWIKEIVDAVDGLKKSVDHGVIGVKTSGKTVVVEVIGSGESEAELDVTHGFVVAELRGENESHAGNGHPQLAVVLFVAVIA